MDGGGNADVISIPHPLTPSPKCGEGELERRKNNVEKAGSGKGEVVTAA